MQKDRKGLMRQPLGRSGDLTPEPYPAGVTPPAPEPEQAPAVQLPLSHYVWLLQTHWIKMVVFIAFSVLVTALMTARIQPLYEATAKLYLDPNAAKNVVGEDSESGTATWGNDDAFMATEMQMVQSEAVLRPVAERYHLLGAVQVPAAVPGRPGAKPKDVPVRLGGLSVSRLKGTYVIEVTYRSPNPVLCSDVANAVARSFVDYSFETRISGANRQGDFMNKELSALKDKATAAEAKVAELEKELAVIDPSQKTSLASARLQQLTNQYTSVQPEKAEAVYDSLQTGDRDAALASPENTHLAEDLARLKDAQAKFEELRQRYGPGNPAYQEAEASVAVLQKQVDQDVASARVQAGFDYQKQKHQEDLVLNKLTDAKSEYDQLNMRMLQYQQARQEALADRSLYDELVKKIRENEVNAGFNNDIVRIGDLAHPPDDYVYPDRRSNLMIAFFGSMLLALAGLGVADELDNTVRDPEQVARSLRTRLIGGLPAIERRRAAPVLKPFREVLAGTGVVAAVGAGRTPEARSRFEEAVRSLRNSIMLSDFDRRLKCILMTSASPSEGKSTVAAHLAIAHAEHGYRTLLIDGDLRRPSLHRLMGTANASGLSTVLLGRSDWRSVLVKPCSGLDLRLLPAGPPAPRATDLVESYLPKILEQAREEFDLVILDAPPLLGFPEPLQMAAAVDGVIIVTRAGQTKRKAVAAVLSTLGNLRAGVLGLVLNEISEGAAGYSYYAYADDGDSPESAHAEVIPILRKPDLNG